MTRPSNTTKSGTLFKAAAASFGITFITIGTGLFLGNAIDTAEDAESRNEACEYYNTHIPTIFNATIVAGITSVVLSGLALKSYWNDYCSLCNNQQELAGEIYNVNGL